MILMAGMEIPIKALREYIENAIDIVVHIQRLADGKRKITSISEVVGFKEEMIELREVFSFRQKGLTDKGEVIGEFVMARCVPSVYKKIRERGIDSLTDIYG